MEGKEKILAAGIAIVFFFLAASLAGMIFAANYDYYSTCDALYPYYSSGNSEQSGATDQAREACVNQEMAENDFNHLMQAISLAVLSLIVIVLGFFIIKIDSVGAGLIWGGILTLIYSAGSYYVLSKTQLEKTLLLALSLIVLIAIGYFKFSKKRR